MAIRIIEFSTGFQTDENPDANFLASSVTVAPTGSLVSTNVQSALVELQTDIDAAETAASALASSVSGHIGASAGAHAASTISVTPSGNLAATNVQAALDELQTDMDGRQPLDPDLTSIANLDTLGLIVRTASGAAATRTIAPPVAGIAINNGNGVLGDLTFSLTNDLEALESLTGSGLAQRTGPDTWSLTTIRGAVGLTSKGDILTDSGSGLARLPVGGSGQLLAADSTTTTGLRWVDAPSGGGIGGQAAGAINYISSPDAEAGVIGWTTYADAASTIPVDGTGGAPTITWTRNTSNPIRGAADFAFTKDAANRQGQGASFDFTIAATDCNKTFKISFDYNTSAANYVEGDMRLYVYDVTSATIISPISFSIPKGVGTRTTQFQTTNSVNYRLIIHFSRSNNVAALTVNFDNFIVSPELALAGTDGTSGLYQAGRAPGLISGSAIPTGMLGERQSWVTPPSNLTLTSSEVDWPNAFIQLSPGVWHIIANVSIINSTGPIASANAIALVRVTDSSNATIQNMEAQFRITNSGSTSQAVSGQTYLSGVVNINTTQTYKIRVYQFNNNMSSSCLLVNDPGQRSVFYAIRVG
jgi:hypothetical protein